MSLLANEFDVRSVLQGQVSFAAVKQICVIHEAMNGCKNLFIKGWLRKCNYFQMSSLNLLDCARQMREDDKPWYDSETSRYSRKRDRIKNTALKAGTPNDWSKYQCCRSKVNNQKSTQKNIFYNNLDIIVSDFQNNDNINSGKY